MDGLECASSHARSWISTRESSVCSYSSLSVVAVAVALSVEIASCCSFPCSSSCILCSSSCVFVFEFVLCSIKSECMDRMEYTSLRMSLER